MQKEVPAIQTTVAEQQEQLELARLAASGDRPARQLVNELAQPIIDFQNKRFCKRYCNDNRFRYICTLTGVRSALPRDSVLCEWGNASYTWMLDDLTNEGRLLQYSGKNGARLKDYFYFIANSLPFYERWKDWRFGRKVYVPTYIKALFPEASQIFYSLHAGDRIPEIAQKLAKSEQDTEFMCHQIICELTRRNRLHLLDPPNTISLSGMHERNDDGDDALHVQADIASFDEAPELTESKQKLASAWAELSVVEQFVIESMVLENQDAEDVLVALRKMDISIKDGVPAKETNRQQLYYFRRKTLARLAGLIEK